MAATPLLEREPELARVRELVQSARGGTGRVLVVEGSAGIGKSALLRAAREVARAEGVTALLSRGSELEREIAFGVVRQMLEAPVRGLAEPERDAVLAGAADLARGPLALERTGAGPSDPFAVLHGLYWLTANLAEQAGTLLLIVDDAHWADAQTLRWLAYLGQRIEELPVLVVAAVRPAEADAAPLTELVARRLAELMPLAPLGESSCTQLVHVSFPDASAAFCGSCHSATSGNPFLLSELLAGLRAEGLSPGRPLDPDGFRSTTISRYVQVRLARLGPPAVALAQALATVGTGARLRNLALLAELDPDEAAAAADTLRAADLVHGDDALDFAHPLVRSAVYSDIPAAARRAAHGRAARVLAEDRSEVEWVAAQLAASEPLGDPWVVQQLRTAAERALAAGAPDAAAGHLTRALNEPPPADERAAVLFELGLALFPIDPSAAVERLREGLAEASDIRLRAWIAIQLAKTLAFSDRPGESVDVLSRTLDEIPPDEPALRLRTERELLGWAHFWTQDNARSAHSDQLRRVAEPLRGDTPDEGALLGLWAWDLVVTDTPRGAVLEVAERALRTGLTFIDPAQGFEIPTLISSAFMFCDELDRALEMFDVGISELSKQGWLVHLAFTYSHRAHVHLRQGALLDAEADIQRSWELAHEFGPALPAWWYSFSNLIQVLLARGRVDDAVALWEESGVGDQLPDAVVYPLPRVVLGELHVARGAVERGAADLAAAGAWLDERGFRNPSWSTWRLSLAPALATLGREDEARAVIEEAIVRARRVGVASVLGRALRVAATVEGPSPAIDLLEESVELLERSPATLELAQSLVEYGAALRRNAHRVESREPLRRALELAHRGGATALEERARQELETAGGRPRSPFASGVDSLTASERRVCQLAAEGSSNPEIAQALFVTRKTVETHLAHAYRKLDVRGRGELASVLEGS